MSKNVELCQNVRKVCSGFTRMFQGDIIDFIDVDCCTHNQACFLHVTYKQAYSYHRKDDRSFLQNQTKSKRCCAFAWHLLYIVILHNRIIVVCVFCCCVSSFANQRMTRRVDYHNFVILFGLYIVSQYSKVVLAPRIGSL